jgi:hypothetical protein
MPINVAESTAEMIECRMYERKLKRREMAQVVEVLEINLAVILRGEVRVNLLMDKII